MEVSNDKWLKPVQAAQYLGVGVRTLARWQQTGAIPYSRLSERVIRYDRDRLDEWVASQQTTASAQ